MNTWSILINRFLYIPPVRVLIANSIILGCVIVLAVNFHFFPEPLKDFIEQVEKWDNSLTTTVIILLLGFSVGVALVFLGIDKYFLDSHQSIRAAAGTTPLLILMYSAIWGLVEISKGHHSLVIFRPQDWKLLDTLMCLRTGSLLLWFSSLSLLKLPVSLGEEGYDFRPWRRDWVLWKRPVLKLRNRVRLTQAEHDQLVELNIALLRELKERRPFVQPVAEGAAKQIEISLGRFAKWYGDKTSVTSADCRALDEQIRADVENVLRPGQAV